MEPVTTVVKKSTDNVTAFLNMGLQFRYLDHLCRIAFQNEFGTTKVIVIDMESSQIIYRCVEIGKADEWMLNEFYRKQVFKLQLLLIK
ncbi:MAG: hypothetical protein ABI675_21440 [Chitinophagaceae bacterium]